jgi:hypothetical protein
VVLSAADITDSTAAGRAMLTAATSAAQWALLRAQSLADYEVATFADLPAANSVTPGRVYTVLGNITGSAGGAFGTRWASNGTVWRPAGGQVLWHLVAQADGVAGGSTTEQILASALFPARVFAGARRIVMRSRWTTSGADTNSRSLRWRVGSAGGVSDAAAQQVTGAGGFTASSRLFVFPTELFVASNTSLGNGWYQSTSQTPDTQAASGNAVSSPTTVPDMTATDRYVSATVQQGASPSSTVSLERASIYVE